MFEKQKHDQDQNFGNGANAFQAGGDNNITTTNINIVGIEEKRAREIFHEMISQLKRDYADEALKIAYSRVIELENRLMPRMESVEGALLAFADPGFQLDLVKAQKTAASTERPADYDLLSELLLQRFQKGEIRYARAAISRAVEIVGDISDDALLGLTVFHAVSHFSLTSGSGVVNDVYEGLDYLNDLFGKIIYGKLPTNTDWFDHLGILDAVRISSYLYCWN